MSKKFKIFVAIALGLAAIIAAVSFLGGSSTDESGLSQVQSGTGGTLSTTALPPSVAIPGQAGSTNEFAGLLSSINTISIDTSIFQNPAYRALRDYPVILGTDVIGRANPFAPIGSDSSSSLPTTTVNVQTLAPGKITSTTAELGALVTLPDVISTSVLFQYGPTDTFGSSTTPVTTTKTGTTLSTITGLTPATKYFVQAVVVRGSSTTIGNVMTFTTQAAATR